MKFNNLGISDIVYYARLNEENLEDFQNKKGVSYIKTDVVKDRYSLTDIEFDYFGLAVFTEEDLEKESDILYHDENLVIFLSTSEDGVWKEFEKFRNRIIADRLTL